MAADYVFVRPNGKPYRPRTTQLRAHAWQNDGAYEDESHGVVILGTLNPEEAWAFAYDSCNHWYGDPDMFGLASPIPGWWRDSYTYLGRTWVEDDERGAPGVMFTWAEMDMHDMNWCGFCQIPVQTGQEAPHKPGCPTLEPTKDKGVRAWLRRA